MGDVDPRWLLDLTQTTYRGRTKSIEVFASKLTNRQLSINALEMLAKEVYASADKTGGPKTLPNSTDLSLFTIFLIAVICKDNGYQTGNLEECIETLRLTVFGFKNIDLKAQERVAKQLLSAAKKIRS